MCSASRASECAVQSTRPYGQDRRPAGDKLPPVVEARRRRSEPGRDPRRRRWMTHESGTGRADLRTGKTASPAGEVSRKTVEAHRAQPILPEKAPRRCWERGERRTAWSQLARKPGFTQGKSPGFEEGRFALLRPCLFPVRRAQKRFPSVTSLTEHLVERPWQSLP